MVDKRKLQGSYEYCELDQEDVAHSEAPLPSPKTTGNTGQGDQNRFYTNPGKPLTWLGKGVFSIQRDQAIQPSVR